jgi:hypothetical protein
MVKLTCVFQSTSDKFYIGVEQFRQHGLLMLYAYVHINRTRSRWWNVMPLRICTQQSAYSCTQLNEQFVNTFNSTLIFHINLHYLFFISIYFPLISLNSDGSYIKLQSPNFLKNGVFWNVTSRGSCKKRRFGGT